MCALGAVPAQARELTPAVISGKRALISVSDKTGMVDLAQARSLPVSQVLRLQSIPPLIHRVPGSPGVIRVLSHLTVAPHPRPLNPRDAITGTS